MALTRAGAAVAGLCALGKLPSAAGGLVTYSCDPWWSCFTSSEEEEDCFKGRSESSCCKASQLIGRMMDVDMEGDKFVDPAHMRDVCLQLLEFPRASDKVEAHLTKCSRGFIGNAMLSGVVLSLAEPGNNRTCSKAWMRARYPMDPAREKSDYDFGWFRLEPWHSTYFHHFQAPVASMLESLAEHTVICRGLGHVCSAFNPWEPKVCFDHHPVVQQWSPQCTDAGKFQIYQDRTNRGKFKILNIKQNRSTERSGRIVEDWLGVLHEVWEKPYYDCLQQAELTRFLERDGRLPWGPLPGEDYFETISLLEAVTAAKDDFVVVEAGSFRGFWALKAVKAYRKKSPEVGSCHIVLIEPEVSTTSTIQGLLRNDMYRSCNVSMYQAFATGPLLDSLLRAFGKINLVHVDIQGAELELLQQSQLLTNIQHLHIGTHSSIIHRHSRAWLVSHGFTLDFDYAPRTFVSTPFGPVVFDDGVLAARQKDRLTCELF
ncbi:unnamed protein product [Symbiodinium sp. CCMP2592]|nr:unnamed protein product [Symbiodinium sp. CCMP2592]